MELDSHPDTFALAEITMPGIGPLASADRRERTVARSWKESQILVEAILILIAKLLHSALSVDLRVDFEKVMDAMNAAVGVCRTPPEVQSDLEAPIIWPAELLLTKQLWIELSHTDGISR